MATRVRSFSKINLGLAVGPLRADGFHALTTMYQTLALHDVVTVSARAAVETRITLTADHAGVPRTETGDAEKNTAYAMVAGALERMGVRADVRIEIEKKLAVQGGLGAGSANAAAALLGLERELGRALAGAERLRLAAEVGSDVPLFLLGGTVLGLGRGEEVFPLPDLPRTWCVVAVPKVGVSTKLAFAELDRRSEGKSEGIGLRAEGIGQRAEGMGVAGSDSGEKGSGGFAATGGTAGPSAALRSAQDDKKKSIGHRAEGVGFAGGALGGKGAGGRAATGGTAGPSAALRSAQDDNVFGSASSARDDEETGIGHRAEVMGVEGGALGEKGGIPMPHALNPMPHALSPMPLLTPSPLTFPHAGDRLGELSRVLASVWVSSGVWTGPSGITRPSSLGQEGDLAENPLLALVRTGIENDFEEVAFSQHPSLRSTKRDLQGSGPGSAIFACLSGSGSALFGLYANETDAREAQRRVLESGTGAVVTETLPRQAYWDTMFAE